MLQEKKTCYHCLSPIPSGINVVGFIKGETQVFCCHGCLGVAEWVNESGLNQYYQVRTGAPKADNIHLQQYQSFDLPEIYQKYTHTRSDGSTEIDLAIEDIHCAACMWLIEKSLFQLTGVISAEGNATTYTLRLVWNDSKTKLSEILTNIARLGYQPFLNRDDGQLARYQKLRRTSLKRLALAGLGMMQVMMYSAALYAGAWQGMEPSMKVLFQWVSFFITTPIFFYSGLPFIQSAARAVKAKHLNMDVPVAIAITLAYCFSVYHLLKGSGEIFFDSVVMFVFFLSASRYLEMMGRYKALLRTTQNTAILPDIVRISVKPTLSATIKTLPLDSLNIGDYLVIRAGETIAADGCVLLGESSVNEALLTGESHPVTKAKNSYVLAGTINQEQTLLVKVTAVAQSTTLAETKRVLSAAQTQKPKVQQLTDRLASYIVAFILFSTVGSYIIWRWIFHDDKAFEVALSVLVATCPCALSLAVPTAYAAVANVLSHQRLLIKNNAIIDIIPKLTQIMFDKTGTLTTNEMKVIHTEILAVENPISITEALTLAATLEQHIHHPIAKAFSIFTPYPTLSRQKIISGKGVQGIIDNQLYTLGNRELTAFTTQQTIERYNPGIYLCQENRVIARFTLSDEINAYAPDTVTMLKKHQYLTLLIASGDSPSRVKDVADKLGIENYYAEQLPQDKLNLLQQLQNDQQKILMIGDGINDAPVLAAADVSMAVGNASALSQSQADVVLLNHDLQKIPLLLTITRKTRQIIHQNIIWAIAYNITAVPFAIMGYLSPWMAALGMSISSLVVLANALRIYWIKTL